MIYALRLTKYKINSKKPLESSLITTIRKEHKRERMKHMLIALIKK